MKKPVFKPEFYRELASENPLGLTLHWREVEAWFNYIAWPAYKTYNYKRHSVAVRRWWARVRVDDVERARDAVENQRMEKAQVQQDELPDECIDDATPHGDTIRHIFGGRGGGT